MRGIGRSLDAAILQLECGQVAGLVRERQSARAIVEDIVGGAEALLKGAAAWVA